MNRLCILTFLVLTFSFVLYAQGPDTLWTRTYGGSNNDFGYAAQQTNDGGYIIVGGSHIGSFNSDIYFIKTDSIGNILWANKYGSSADQETGFSVDQTSDGGYIATGITAGFQGTKIYLIKVDSLGDSLWADDYGIRSEAGYSVQQTSDERFIVAGYTGFYGSGGLDVALLKIDRNGGVIWSTIYGDTADEAAYSVQQTNDGGYIVVGYTESFGAGGDDVWLLKTDSGGDIIWNKAFGDSGNDRGYCVQQTNDAGYVITGVSCSDVYLIKTDSSGVITWTKSYGGRDYDVGKSVVQTNDGGYIITGSTLSFGSGDADVWFLKTDYNGEKLWSQTYGGISEDVGYNVVQTDDDGFAIAGYTRSFGAGGADVYLIRTTPEGPRVEEGINAELNRMKIPGLVYGDVLRLSGVNNHTKAQIFDILGREVLSQKVSPQKSYIELNNLTAGIYFLSIKEEKPRLSKFVLIR